MQVAIVKYNAGNIYSVDCALRRVGITPILTDDKEALMAADKVIFPGVGEAATTMTYLREQGLDRLIRDLRQPVLGICIGMQLMCRHSEEGDTDCLGIFDVDVKRFRPESREQKVPHMGWNSVENRDEEMFAGLPKEFSVYFVHSYCAQQIERPYVSGITEYEIPFACAVHQDNIYGCQFHPEKSGDNGMQILRNFLALKGAEQC